MTDGFNLEEFNQVSDTALMVAGCRASENARADGLIRDPFAERLAGERGVRLARATPFFALMSVIVGLRSRSLDGLVETLAGSGKVKTIANLGAGLDSRPWRLALPPDLRWIEVDSAEVLEFKRDRLASDAPKCRLEQLSADLNRAEDRARLYSAIGAQSAVMMTEGLLMYLERGTVEALVRDAPQYSGVDRWLMDAEQKWQQPAGPAAESRPPGGAAASTGAWLKAVERLRPADYFSGREILEVFRQAGWQVGEARRQAEAFARLPAARLLELRTLLGQIADPETLKHARDEVSGVYLLEFPAR